jgi:hypothetical protein
MKDNNNNIKRMVKLFIEREVPKFCNNVEGTEIMKFIVASIEATSYKVAKAAYIQGIGDLAYVMCPIINKLINMMNRVIMTQFVLIVDESRLVNIKNISEFDKFIEYMHTKYPDLSPDIKIDGDIITIGGKLRLLVPQVVSTI